VIQPQAKFQKQDSFRDMMHGYWIFGPSALIMILIKKPFVPEEGAQPPINQNLEIKSAGARSFSH